MLNHIKKLVPTPLLAALQQYKGQRQTIRQGQGQPVLLNDFLSNYALEDPHARAFVQHYLGYAYRMFRGHFIKASQLLRYFDSEQLATLKHTESFPLYLRLSNMAILSLQEDPEVTKVALHQHIGPKGRNMLRKAEKNGYSVQSIDYDAHLDDIFAINTSKGERQGRAMSADYLTYPEKRSTPLRSLGQKGIEYHCFGCFQGQGRRLVAYASFYRFGNVFRINKVLGHGEHLTYGIMNQLFAQTAIQLSETYPGSFLVLLGLPKEAKVLVSAVRRSKQKDWLGDWVGEYLRNNKLL